ncbi:MAG: GrpB family protein [Clostridiales bacterium]|nr:GrpB family protein [Clostridiales bacterium]
MEIGLRRGTVVVEPHKIEWEIAAQKIISNLKDDIIDVQHIGSTAIKSICAKPIVDIVVGVSSFDRIIKHNDDLMKRGT